MKEEKKKNDDLKENGSKNMKKNKDTKHQVRNKISALEQQGEQLQLDLDREIKRLDELVKLQKNYENPEKLTNLKREFEEKNAVKNRLEVEQKKNKKLNDERSSLQERIKLLKNMAEKYYKEKEQNFN